MIVTVVNKHFDPPQPVPDARVSVSYFDRLETVTADRHRTNRQGQTELEIPSEAADRGDLRIEVSDTAGLVIYQPAEGLLTGVPSALTLVLLPKGSPALLEPTQIEAAMRRLSLLTVQDRKLKLALGKVENEKPSFDTAVQAWAADHGFLPDEVDKRMRAWADDVLARKQEKSLEEQAEAELVLRHYDRAAALFLGVVNSKKDALRKEQEKYLERRHKDLSEIIQAAMQTAGAQLLGLHFRDATATMDDARAQAAEEHHHYPNDETFRKLWLWASVVAEGSRVKEGEMSLSQEDSGQNGAQLFATVAENCRSLLGELDRSGEPDEWSYAQLFLAGAYFYQSEISNNREAPHLRAKAVAAVEASVSAHSKEKDPQTWAFFEQIYALLLAAKAARGITDGGLNFTQASEVLAQATLLFRNVLDVLSKTTDPKSWGETQSQLGGILALQALLAKGDRSAEFMNEAEAANVAALEVLSPEKFPDERASAQQVLGLTLSQRAEASSGSQSLELLARASAAFKAALDIRTKEKDPAKWANTEDNLAASFKNRARLSQGQDAIDLLGQSIAGYKAELTVFTKDRFPQRWASIEDSLGNALAMQGARMSGNESHETLTQAAAAYRAALEVFTKEGYPPRWMQAQLTLGTVLGTLTFRTIGTESDELLKQAITAYSEALELLTPDIDAEQWVRAEASLGELLAVQGQRSGNDAAESFRQSAAAYENALRVAPTNAAILSPLSALYHEFLLDFGKAYEFAQRTAKENPNESNQLNLAETALTTSHFSECLEALKGANEAQLEHRLVPARRTLLLACQWGAGQKKEAAQTAESISTYGVGLPKGGWTTSGDRKYLGTAKQFRLERSLWIQLFQSLQDNDGQVLARAANNLHSAMVK
jgi:hypothetical protein